MELVIDGTQNRCDSIKLKLVLFTAETSKYWLNLLRNWNGALFEVV